LQNAINQRKQEILRSSWDGSGRKELLRKLWNYILNIEFRYPLQNTTNQFKRKNNNHVTFFALAQMNAPVKTKLSAYTGG
jgi:hypothetical protein